MSECVVSIEKTIENGKKFGKSKPTDIKHDWELENAVLESLDKCGLELMNVLSPTFDDALTLRERISCAYENACEKGIESQYEFDIHVKINVSPKTNQE